jgi:hypothetical protein
MIGRPSTGLKPMALMGAKHRPMMTPASMALASGVGMDATARPSGLNRPAMMISTAQMMKAPTAAEKPPSITPVAASSAPPGVDHAMLMGSRVIAERTMAQRPTETDSAISPDAASKSVAPTPFSPCSTTAKELAKPTKAVSRPMNRLWRENSFSMAGLWHGEMAIIIADQKTLSLARLVYPAKVLAPDLRKVRTVPCCSRHSARVNPRHQQRDIRCFLG